MEAEIVCEDLSRENNIKIGNYKRLIHKNFLLHELCSSESTQDQKVIGSIDPADRMGALKSL